MSLNPVVLMLNLLRPHGQVLTTSSGWTGFWYRKPYLRQLNWFSRWLRGDQCDLIIHRGTPSVPGDLYKWIYDQEPLVTLVVVQVWGFPSNRVIFLTTPLVLWTTGSDPVTLRLTETRTGKGSGVKESGKVTSRTHILVTQSCVSDHLKKIFYV